MPGPRGPTGTNGTNGTNGSNAFTATTADFAMPAELANVAVSVGDTTWASIGQILYVDGAGYLEVMAKPSATQFTLKNLENTATGVYTSNVAPATNVAFPKRVAPAGLQGPAGTNGTSGANANGYYLVSRATSAPVNAVNLGTLTTGLLKVTVAAGVATPSTAVGGTDFQAADAELAAIAGLTSAADSVPYFTGSGTAALATFTAAGRALVDDADATAQRVTLGLGTIAVQAANSVAITGGSVTGITDLAVADGGTGASTAAAARTNLGLSPVPTDLIVVKDIKATTTAGGTFTNGAWQTRTLNTEETDTGSHASLAANQITLAAGTYRARIFCPAYRVDAHQARLQNITDGATLIFGVNAFAANTTPFGGSVSVIEGRFTLAGSKLLEVQHRCVTTQATDGFGGANSFGGSEIYTVATFEREAG